MLFGGIGAEPGEEGEVAAGAYKDDVHGREAGLSDEQELAQYLTFPGGGYPAMVAQQYFKGAEASPESREAAEKLKQDLVEDPWISMPHTDEENKQLQGFGSDIEKYVEEM